MATIAMEAALGADGGVAALTAAARRSLEGSDSLVVLGDARALAPALSRLRYEPMRLRLHDIGPCASVATHDEPGRLAQAARAVPACLDLLEAGEVDALVTAAPGSVLLAEARRRTRAMHPAMPAALAAVVPTLPRAGTADPFALLLDAGGVPSPSDPIAGADALVGWAVAGAIYARVVSGVREPGVALLAADVTPELWPAPLAAAASRLRSLPPTTLRPVGPVRAIDVPRGLADVIVADGAVGAAVRSLLEGITDLTVEAARYAWKARTTWRVGLRLLSDAVGQLQKVSEFRMYGGAPLLGLERLVLVASPHTGEEGMANALKLAAKCERAGLMAELRAGLYAPGVLSSLATER